MKIAFMSQPWEGTLPPASAVPIWIYQVARRLAAKSNEVTVYAKRKDHQSHIEEDKGVTYRLSDRTLDERLLPVTSLADRFLPVDHPVTTTFLYYPFYGRSCARDAYQQGYDVVHMLNFSQYIPVVRRFHPTAKIVLHMQCDWLGFHDQRAQEKRLRQADLIIGTTDYITNNIRHRFPSCADRCHTIFNGVDVEKFTRQEQQAEHTETDTNTDSAPKRLLFVGRVSPERGIHVLLKAFEKVVAAYPNVHLDIVGPPWVAPLRMIGFDTDQRFLDSIKPFYDGRGYQTHLDEMITPEMRDKISFVGFVANEDLPAYYRRADIFVYPSVWYEAFGIPLAEAMAAKTPPISSTIGGIPEVVEHGKTGLCVSPGDADELADALLTLLQDDDRRRAMGEAGRQRAIEHFSWDVIADATLQRYRALFE
jgi:glycosyltransferase involved in cell wall biosynthesis